MKSLQMYSSDGLFVSYNIADIRNIEHGKAKEFNTKSECEANGIKPTDSLIIINFKDGSRASFGDNWIITFG